MCAAGSLSLTVGLVVQRRAARWPSLRTPAWLATVYVQHVWLRGYGCGCVAAWLCGCVTVWLCGCMAVWLWLWLCGCVAAWLRGCGCVWLCGCGCVWLWGCV